MGEASFRVEVSADAWADLTEISESWSARGEAWRGEKYFRDLVRALLQKDLSHRRAVHERHDGGTNIP